MWSLYGVMTPNQAWAVPLSAREFQLRISRRARRLRIDVSARRGVVVVVPEGTPHDVVDRFVSAKRRWIERARDRVNRGAAALPQPYGPPLPEELHLRAVGEQYRVETQPAARNRVATAEDVIRVEGCVEPPAIRAALTRWLKQRAKDTLAPRLAEHARNHGLDYRRSMVRGQRTRWASCSGRGTISLNFKLLFLPPALVDHVMLHELAHTRHLNHSPRFWNFLAELDPNWRAHHTVLTRAARWLPAWVEIED